MLLIYLSRYVCCYILLAILVAGEKFPQVRVKEGELRGVHRLTRGQRTISAFEGIPYAQPPIDSLRFQPPVPIGAWKGVKNATKPHAICPQRDIYRRTELIEGEEDCLYLNVYVPQNPKVDGPLPVMIFFHGGGWLCGGGNSYWYGPDILLDQDIILVVTNYRLGALGFISTGDAFAPGNNGLKDQNLAMQWVKNNIAVFGGDTASIAIFGESAGGASVQYHMVSPLSKGLFKAAISQSGTAHCLWALAPAQQGRRHAHQLAEAFNCPTRSTPELLDCLRKIPADDIVAKDKIFMKWDTDPMIPFKPVIEPNLPGAFLTQHPLAAMEAGNFSQVPWMVGLNTEDGALRSAGVCGDGQLLDEFDRDFERVVPISLLYDETSQETEEITRRIRDFYFGGKKKIDNESRSKITDMWTDGWFLYCADAGVRAYLKYAKKPVYYYLFGHRGVASFTEIFGDKTNDYGVCHADDLQYLFPVGDGLFPDRPPSKDDQKVAEILTTLWTNFAKTGNPNSECDSLPNEWHPVSTENTNEMEYYYIDAVSAEMRHGLYPERSQFWRDLPIHSDNAIPKDEL